MTTPTPPPGPDPMSLLVAVTRVEVKMDSLAEKVHDQGVDLKELKDRRWPLGPATLALSLVGSALGVWALLKGH